MCRSLLRGFQEAPLLSRRCTIPFNRAPLGLRYASTETYEAGEHKSGHIKSGPNEGVIFFNCLFPYKLQLLFRLPWSPEKAIPKLISKNYNAIAATDPAKVLDNAFSKVSFNTPQVVEVLPRLKEGGAFLKFAHGPDATPETVAEVVQDYLKKNKVRSWWNPLQKVRVNLVKGAPWVEDLHRLPTSRVKVEFLSTHPGDEVAELSQEQLYSFFRPYGRLADIITQPSDSKVLPKYAYLDFTKLKKAIMAKNCLHGYIVSEAQGGGKPGTLLRLSYERRQKSGWIKDWLFGHPRIVIPLLAALVAGITVAIFDPIRTLSIKSHITRHFHLEDNKIFRWFKTQAEDLVKKVRNIQDDEQASLEGVWSDRRDTIEQIRAWLMETADTFIIVQGPRGSGKKEMVVDWALKHKKNKLVIDCKPIQEARGDVATICAAAAEVGYKPVFSWLNSISGLVDLAAKGTTGVDTGFSETVENQLGKIWNNTATALKQIALEARKKDDKDANLSDDEYLEAHPERRPVVIIDNFLHKAQEGGIVYDKIAEWAARLTTSNIAHVIFLTNDVSFSKSLSKALPDRVFRQVSLGDCSPEVAKRYVINHLDFDSDDKDEGLKKLSPSQRRNDLGELDGVIEMLGGRLTDLEFLARRIKAGETPSKAVKEIIDQSASEILKMFLLLGSDDTRQWTPQQAWTLVKLLATNSTLRYNEILLTDAYKNSGDRALAALESAELISIASPNGRPTSIKPGKPVYQPAFQALTEDPVLRSKLDLAVLAEQISIEGKSIDKYEQELHLLGELPKQPAELNKRINWLLGKIMASQAKIEAYERESGALKKVLQSEF